MEANGQTISPAIDDNRRHAGVSTADLINAPMEPAVDMKPGQYPAIFVKWSDETFSLKSKFHAGGRQQCIEAFFAVRNTAPTAEGEVRSMRVLLPVPSRKLHPMSNTYKMLKPLAGSNEKLWDERKDNIATGVKLSDFCGSTCFVVVEEKKGFANITAVNLAPVGVSAPYPSLEEGKAAVAAAEHEEDVAQGSRVPF